MHYSAPARRTMAQAQAVLPYLGILCLICLPGSSFPQTDESLEKRNDKSCRPSEFQCKSGLCVDASNLCDGSKECDDGSDESKELCSSFRCPSRSFFQCESGTCIEAAEVCDGISQCVDGSDENPQMCKGAFSSTSSTIEPPLAEECGKFDQKPFPLQKNGSLEGSWLPWFALIYMIYEGSFNYVCSGSVVSSHTIVTGAACVYDGRRKQSKDPSSFKVVIGRYNLERPTPTEQQVKVNRIHVSPNYRGDLNYFESDIAILLLEEKIKFNHVVRPICLDLDGLYSNYLSPGKLGIIGSWGGNARNEIGMLRIHAVPYVDFRKCVENVPEAFVAFLSSDKFCSGIINVTTVCEGDYGSGFATQFRDGKWYLSGLVSVAATSERNCNPENYFAVTKVSEHKDFLEKYVKEDFQNNGESDRPHIGQDTHPSLPPSRDPYPHATTTTPPRATVRPPPTRPSGPHSPTLPSGPPDLQRPTHPPGPPGPPGPQRPTRPPSQAYPILPPSPSSSSSCSSICNEHFLCQSGEWFNLSVVCNGLKDCEDGSDEDQKQCEMKNSTLSCSYLPSMACYLPEQPENGQFTFVGCQALDINMNSRSRVPGGVALIYNCNPGYTLHGSSVIVCNNAWTSDPPICSKIHCPPLIDPSREIDCVLNGEDIDCTEPAEPGTRATLRCKTHFENVPTLSTYDITCEKYGKWSREVHSCVPKCGEPNPHGITLIGHGERSKRSEYPWHIGLYKFQKDGSLSLHCSGSLVSSRVFVTAAHCFPEDAAKHMESVLKDYKAVAGKYYRDWSNTSKYTQHLDMEKLVIHRRYRGGSRNYVHDIAVVILKYQVRIDEAVRPVCVDFDKSFLKYFTPGISGTVLGWGWTENQTWSDVILTASLPYVSQVECEDNTPRSFHDFILGDKFCAGKDKTVVCQGDSGGGYAVRFPHSARWYLAGVVSIGATEECAVYPYAAFTDIYSNLEFIRRYVDQYI